MLLENKKGLIIGVANKRSLAWACAEMLAQQGARLAFSYQEHFADRVQELIRPLKDSYSFQMDITRDSDIDAGFSKLQQEFGSLDFLIHAVAHAKTEELEGHYVNTSREGYLMAQDISAYSLVAVSKRAVPLMPVGGSIVTLTYLGGERVVPNYNVMGVAKAALEMSVRYLASDLGEKQIRVNAISAGPVRTLASSGVGGFKKMLEAYPEKAPLHRNVEPAEVGNTALFLCSSLASGITGEVIHVDCGYHIMGM